MSNALRTTDLAPELLLAAGARLSDVLATFAAPRRSSLPPNPIDSMRPTARPEAK